MNCEISESQKKALLIFGLFVGRKKSPEPQSKQSRTAELGRKDGTTSEPYLDQAVKNTNAKAMAYKLGAIAPSVSQSLRLRGAGILRKLLQYFTEVKA